MSEPRRPVVYFDGACPLCRREIAFYRRRRGADGIEWIDLSESLADPAPDLTRAAALARFHLRDPAGRLWSGAAAFARLWQALPPFRPLGRLAALPGPAHVAEWLYRGFLMVRRWRSGAAGRCDDAACAPHGPQATSAHDSAPCAPVFPDRRSA